MKGEETEALREVLLGGDLLNEVQRRVLTDYHRAVGGSLKEAAVQLGFITPEQLASALRQALSVVVTPEMVHRALFEQVPFKLLSGYEALPIIHDGETVLAVEDGELEPLLLEELWTRFERTLPVVQAAPGTVRATLRALGAPTSRTEESLPAVTAQQLAALLVRKGILSAEDLQAAAENVPVSAAPSGA